MTIMTDLSQTPLVCPLQTGGTPTSQPTENSRQLDRMMPKRILEIGYAFWRSKALMSAVELDVLQRLPTILLTSRP